MNKPPDPPAGRPAVVLLSGGLDSATTLAIAKAEGYLTYALSFRYGQRHAAELDAARAVAARLGVARHEIASIDLRAFGGSALTADIRVPENRSAEEIGAGIPITYVPARNTIFLAFALAWCEVLGAADIFIGATPIAGRNSFAPSSRSPAWRLARVSSPACGFESTRRSNSSPRPPSSGGASSWESTTRSH